jgi:hypothetical protein
MPDTLCLVVCMSFEAEVAAVLGPGGQPDIRVVLIPATCARSCALWENPSGLPLADMTGCTDVHVLAGRRPYSTVSALPGESVRYLAPGDECHSLFAPSSILAEHLASGAYIVTPGWLAHWKSHIRSWGFDSEGFVAFFHETVKSIVLLDTLVSPQSAELLREFGQYAELPVSRLPGGLDYFRLLVNSHIGEWRHERSRRQTLESVSRANRQSAEYAMAFDLLYSLAGTMNEEDLAGKLLDLFSSLFAPERSGVSFSRRGQTARVWSRLSGQGSAPEPVGEEHAMLPGGRGFTLRLGYREDTLGVV